MLLVLVKPLGTYMARVYQGQPCGLDRVLGPLERLIYRLCGRTATEDMSWKMYAVAMLLFNVVGLLAVYVLQRVQGWLPPESAGAGRGNGGLVVQHGRQLRDKHELAGLTAAKRRSAT